MVFVVRCEIVVRRYNIVLYGSDVLDFGENKRRGGGQLKLSL